MGNLIPIKLKRGTSLVPHSEFLAHGSSLSFMKTCVFILHTVGSVYVSEGECLL